MTLNGNTYQGQLAKFIFGGFSVIVLLISALTSFSFFYTYFGNLVPPGILESDISRLISGVIGVILFDLAAAVWLFVFLQASDTPEQRAVSLFMAIVCFIGAASSSIAYLVLSATGELALAESTRESVGIFALVVVIAGVVFNFGSGLAHSRFSLANKVRVAESDLDDKVQNAHRESEKDLVEMVELEVKALMKAASPELAKIKAGRIVRAYLDRQGVPGLGEGDGVLPNTPNIDDTPFVNPDVPNQEGEPKVNPPA